MNAATAAERPASEPDSVELFRYSFAGLSVLATVGVQLALHRIITPAVPLLVSLLAVMVTAYFCGRGPSLAVTAANLVANWYFFTKPPFSFAVMNVADAWRLAAFAGAGITIGLVSDRFSNRRQFPPLVLILGSSLLLVIASVLVWVDFQQSREAEGWVEHTYQVLNAHQELLTTIDDAESSQRNYLLTGEQRYLDSYRAALDSEHVTERRLQELTIDNAAQQIRLKEVDRLTKIRVKRLDEAIEARRGYGLDAAVELINNSEGGSLMDDIRRILGAVRAEEHNLLNVRIQEAATQTARTRWVVAMGPVVLVTLLIVAGAIIERDVSRLKTSETMLRRQAELLDKAPGPIIVWELGGAIEYWNKGAERLYGFSRKEALGRNHNELLHPIHPLGMPAIQNILAIEGEWRGELKHMIQGREIVVESHMTLVTQPGGRKTVLKVNRDVTEEKRAREESERLNRELEQRVKDRTEQLEATNKELEAFAYSVSHDLRAPLRGIDGWSKALTEDYGAQLDEDAREYLARVREETQRMGRLIDDLLKLSRLTRVELQHEAVDLTSLAREISGRLKESEPARKMEFVIQEGLAANGDGRLLEIALSNLLNNAVKFTGPRSVARIEIGQAKCKNEMAFYVRDNGVGFDMAYAALLYGPFQRLHKHTEFPATGVGLATVQRVLRRHGGKIWADARPDQGATFYFTIGGHRAPRQA